MSRLPTVGSDDNTWGNILNDYLSVEHNADGSQKAIDPSKITGTAEVQSNKGQANGYAPLDGTGKVPSSNLPVGASTPDATTSSKGIVQLAGDLAGTAALPTVPGLANKLDKSTVTTKGDLLAATASAAITRVGVGSDGTVLTADSTQTTGVKWGSAGSASLPYLFLNSGQGIVGDGTTDDSVAINTALTGLGPGTAYLGKASYALNSPIIVPNGVGLAGVGAMQGGSTLTASASFPHSTISGNQTTPASSATTFTLTVASTAGFPLGSGGITPPGGTGVLCCQGITIFYTGTTSSTFTGCRVQTADTNVTLLDTTAVSTFMVWLTDPGTQSVGFGSRIDNVGIVCNGVAGISGIHSCHIQEGGGWSFLRITQFKNFGVRLDVNPAMPGGSQNNDWDAHTCWIIFSNAAETNAIGVDIMQQWAAPPGGALQQERGLRNMNFAVQGSSLIVGKAAIRVNGSIGTYQGIYIENMNTGVLIGDINRCAVTIESASHGNNWGTGALVELGNTTGNSATVRRISKSNAAAVPNRKILIDHVNADTAYTIEEMQQYVLFADGTFSVNGGARVGLSTARPAASVANRGALWMSTDTGRFSICDGTRWWPITTDAGITLVNDSSATGARDNSSSSTLTVTFTKTTTVGNLALIGCGQSGNFVLSSITDSRGNTWQVDKTHSGQGFTANIASCLVTIAHQIGDTLTLTYTGASTYSSAIVSEWSGIKNSSWLDVTGGNGASSGSGSTNATPSRTQADELLFGVIAYNNASNQTAGTNYNILTTQTSGVGNRKVTPEYQVVSSVGTDAATWNGTPGSWEAVIATYKAAKSTV